jgi:hypothetical protein
MERTDTTPTPVSMIRRIDHREAMQVATVENRRFADQLAGFSADDWSKPTDCPLWNVRAVAAHVIGSAAAQASPREFVRQVRGGRPMRVEIGSPFWWDGMNEVQVRERADRSTDELRAEHGEPCTLDLSGPAGGCYVAGTGGEHVAMDAIESCRILSGRGYGEGVLRHKLPL